MKYEEEFLKKEATEMMRVKELKRYLEEIDDEFFIKITDGEQCFWDVTTVNPRDDNTFLIYGYDMIIGNKGLHRSINKQIKSLIDKFMELAQEVHGQNSIVKKQDDIIKDGLNKIGNKLKDVPSLKEDLENFKISAISEIVKSFKWAEVILGMIMGGVISFACALALYHLIGQ